MGSHWSGHRVVVTGGTGFLGSAVAKVLGASGADDVVLLGSHQYDLRLKEDAERLFDDLEPQTVIHLAARVGGIGANMARPADLYLDNLLMGTFVIDAALRHRRSKLVVAGTICSYPKHTPVPFREESLWTGYPEETNAPYGVAKLAHLVQLQANKAQYGQSCAYVMPTNLYGPGDKFHPDVSHVIPALIKKCVDAKEMGLDRIVVWGTGSASREFLFVDDAAKGIVLAAERYDSREPVNLGADREVPIRELVQLIVDAVGFEGKIEWDESKPDGQPRRNVDPTRAREQFGFVAETPLEEGIRRTVDWYLANRDSAEARRN